MTAKPTPLRDRLLGPRCPDCGVRVFPRDHDEHQAVEHAGVNHVHGKLLDDTRLCPAAPDGFATVFLDIVTCPVCRGRMAKVQGRRSDAVEPTPRGVR